jgi:hypothetical protein
MKKKYYIIGCITIFLLIYYYIDREYFMKKRVLRHNLWEHVSGDRVSGDFIETKDATFHNDTIIFNFCQSDSETLILRWQYFSMMKVIDPKTNKSGNYAMKGANWTNYLFKCFFCPL